MSNPWRIWYPGYKITSGADMESMRADMESIRADMESAPTGTFMSENSEFGQRQDVERSPGQGYRGRLWG